MMRNCSSAPLLLFVATAAFGQLEPGDRLSLVVDPAQRTGAANRMVGGVSFHRVAGWAGLPYSREGEYKLSPVQEQWIRDLRLPLTRFYALGDETPSLEAAIDRAAEVVRKLGIPEKTVVLEFENQGARTSLTPEQWTNGVRHSVARGYGFHLWEIGNEPYMRTSMFKTPEEYVAHFKQVSAAIKKVQPEAKTVISVLRGDARWSKGILTDAAGFYDLVAPHWYSFSQFDFEEMVLGDNAAVAKQIADLNAHIRAVNPGREVAQYDTEWGTLVRNAAGEPGEKNVRNANMQGVAYRAVRLMYYARGGLVQAASGWEMATWPPSYGCCTLAVGSRGGTCMLYWLYRHFNRNLGDWLVAVSGVAPHYKIERAKEQVGNLVPETPVLATLGNDGKTLHLMLVNGSWSKAWPASVEIRNRRVVSANGIALSNDDIDAIPLVKEESDFVHPLQVEAKGATLRFTLPAHSVAFLNVEIAPAR